MERFFDMALSGLGLLVLSPLLVPVCLVLKFSGEGEVFFLQDRIGRNGEEFKLIKFATMLKQSPNMGTGTVTMKDDPRVLPVGKVLRKTKINELPQLLNIFLGDMSVIGPRPLTRQAFAAYSQMTQETIKRVRPGLSGVGSIVFRGEEEIMHGATASVDFYANVMAPYKGALEEWFVSNKSLYIYFAAIFATACVVVFPGTNIAWRIFRDLPEPPIELREALNYAG